VGRSVAQQSADNARRRAAGQPTKPIAYDSGPAGHAQRAETGGYGAPPPSTAGGATTPGRIPGGGSGTTAPTPWTPTDKPGYGETYWEKYGNQWQQPGASSNYWNGVQGQFANPTAHENNVGGYAQQLGQQPGALENLYDQYSQSGEFTNPGAGENWWAQNGAQYGSPSAGEQTLGNVIGQYQQPGAMEDWQRQNGQFFTQNGVQEQWAQGSTQGLVDNTTLGTNWRDIARHIEGANRSGNYFDQIAPQLTGSFTEGMARNYAPSLSYNEQLLLGGGAAEGLDSLYGRLFDKSSERISNAGAARGGFNTGASMRAIEESDADLRAQQVRDYMAASQAADSSRLADQDYGLNLMQGADTSLSRRLGLGLQGAGQADSMALARAAAEQDLYTGVSDEYRQNMGLAGEWQNQSQQNALGRMLGGAGVANDAQGQMLARLGGMGNAANMQANQWLNRMNSGGAAASRAQGDQNQRIQTGIGAAGNTQTAWQNRIQGAAGLDQNAQQMMWERIMNGANIAGQADNSDLARLTGGFTAANAAEQSKQNRQNSTFDNLYRSGAGQAGAYGSYQDQARREQAQATADEINGLIAQGGITSQEIMAKYGSRMASLGLVIQGGKVVAGAVSGNPGLMASGAGGQKAPYDPDAALPLGYTG
jgi:hypothetical protein